MTIIDKRGTQQQQQQNKNRKVHWGTETIVKGWELNDLAVRLS